MRTYSAKETYDFKEPTNRRLCVIWCFPTMSKVTCKSDLRKRRMMMISFITSKPTKETYKRDLQKRPTHNLDNFFGQELLLAPHPFRANVRQTCQKRPIEIKRDPQKRPTKETYKRDQQKRTTNETYKKDLPKTPASKEAYRNQKRPTKETYEGDLLRIWEKLSSRSSCWSKEAYRNQKRPTKETY